MKKKDILEVEIVSYGMDGEGVAKEEGFVIFIPTVLVGEIVKIEITEVKKTFARGKVIKLIKPVKERVEPKCPIYFRCGGCEMQHLEYEYQLKVKKDNIKNCIDKACHIDCMVSDVIYGKSQFGYRNKVQIPIRKINGKAMAGFYKPNSHFFVPFAKSDDPILGDCLLHTREMQNIIDTFLDFVNDNGISTYNEETGKGLVRHLVLRRINNSYSICVVINGDKLVCKDNLIQRLLKKNLQFSLYVSKNKRNTNVIMGNSVECIYGEKNTIGEANGVKIMVNPMSFLQVNDEVRDLIYNKVIDTIKTNETKYVLDIFSGIGIMSNMIAKEVEKVYAVEIVKEAIEDANKIAELNNNKNIENILGDAAVKMPELVRRLDKKTAVILDPPRKGCDDSVLESLNKSLPDMIIYVSCNPATLARDVSKLISNYSIKEIIPFEMFPMTKHVECVVLLSKVQE